MKLFIYFIFTVAISFLTLQLYRLAIHYYALKQNMAELAQKTEPLKKENQRVSKELEALKNPANIERELRRAGFAAPDEKVFIIVPKH